MAQRNLKFVATKPQAAFLALDCRYPLFTAGKGSGKTRTLIVSAFMDATHSPNALIALYEPTFPLVRDVLVPAMKKFLTEQGIEYEENKNEHEIWLKSPQVGTFLFRAYSEPENLIGYEVYRSHIDELDTIPEDKAKIVWDNIISRNRQWPAGLPDKYMKWHPRGKRLEPINRVSTYSTPEGFKYTYKTWGLNKLANGKWKNPEYQYVTASTASNPYNPSDYIDSLRRTYSEALVDAYIEGRWVNMQSGSVYRNYDREKHRSFEKIRPKESLYIGCDFNVGKTAATIYVKRQGGKEYHAVAELSDMYDTPEMIRLIKEKWADKGHHITMYPDTTGSNRSAQNADVTKTSVALLRNAGFLIRAHSKNPGVANRVQTVNVAFSAGLVFINDVECPVTANCLEQQAYNKQKEPDKESGFDHQNDATTYPIAYELKIRKAIFSVPVKWA